MRIKYLAVFAGILSGIAMVAGLAHTETLLWQLNLSGYIISCLSILFPEVNSYD